MPNVKLNLSVQLITLLSVIKTVEQSCVCGALSSNDEALVCKTRSSIPRASWKRSLAAFPKKLNFKVWQVRAK